MQTSTVVSPLQPSTLCCLTASQAQHDAVHQRIKQRTLHFGQRCVRLDLPLVLVVVLAQLPAPGLVSLCGPLEFRLNIPALALLQLHCSCLNDS